MSEGFDLLLTLGAGITVAAVAAAAARGVSAWRSANRRTRAWMQTARPLALPGTSIPAFEIDVEKPVLALVGVLRPRMLVTRGLIAALTPEELSASVAHEIVHSRSWDNLKRLAMRSVPDILPRSAAMRALEERWVASSEHHADRVASEHDPHARCALASALVKVAKLTPHVPPLAEPISTLVGGGDIASRVRGLLDDRTGRVGTSSVARGRLDRRAVAVAGNHHRLRAAPPRRPRSHGSPRPISAVAFSCVVDSRQLRVDGSVTRTATRPVTWTVDL